MTRLIEVRNLKKYFPIKTGLGKPKKFIHAVDRVNLSIEENETFGLVGESGCGKSTLGKLILRLFEPTEGEVFFRDRNIFNMKSDELKEFRMQCQIIFQNVYASLNPRKTVRGILEYPLRVKGVDKNDIEAQIEELLRVVHLDTQCLYRYPHQFSGGQRQRIAIARAIAMNPKFIVADEPISALDASVRSDIINLLIETQKILGVSYLYISHNLAIVRAICTRVAVMYLGRVVELAKSDQLFRNPLHPYTKAIISATPVPDPEALTTWKPIILKGDVPSPVDLPHGCKFHPRCIEATPICSESEQNLKDIGNGHFVACHKYT